MYTETFYWFRRLDDDMRAAMAIDWIAREREKPGKDICHVLFLIRDTCLQRLPTTPFSLGLHKECFDHSVHNFLEMKQG
jgi:hypothetical protein